MVNIYWTEEAKRNLKGIHDYIAQANRTAAKNVVKSIQNKARLLQRFPELGAVYPGITNREILFQMLTRYDIVITK